jgi:hypothetical protein
MEVRMRQVAHEVACERCFAGPVKTKQKQDGLCVLPLVFASIHAGSGEFVCMLECAGNDQKGMT